MLSSTNLIRFYKNCFNILIPNGIGSHLTESIVRYQNRIYVPPVLLQKKTLDCYHHFLCHPGGQSLANTIASVCYWKGLTSPKARQVAWKFPICQNKCKVRNHQYGHLLPPRKEIETPIPWDTVHIDLKGP
jgi:hypothetical protein